MVVLGLSEAVANGNINMECFAALQCGVCMFLCGLGFLSYPTNGESILSSNHVKINFMTPSLVALIWIYYKCDCIITTSTCDPIFLKKNPQKPGL